MYFAPVEQHDFVYKGHSMLLHALHDLENLQQELEGEAAERMASQVQTFAEAEIQ